MGHSRSEDLLQGYASRNVGRDAALCHQIQHFQRNAILFSISPTYTYIPGVRRTCRNDEFCLYIEFLGGPKENKRQFIRFS
jgi:hypothetical protein